MILFVTLPLLPPVTIPTAAWDAAVILVAGAVIGYGYLSRVKSASQSVSTSTAGSTTKCADPPPPPKCKEAADDIDEVLNGRKNPGGKDYKSIKARASELKANPKEQPMFWEDANPGMPRPSGSDQFGHMIAIEDQQKRLTNALQSYYANNCNNLPSSVLKDAAEWAMKDVFDLL